MGSLQSDGYLKVDGFLPRLRCEELVAAADALLGKTGDHVIRYEHDFPESLAPAERVSKAFRVHRQEPFRSVSADPTLVDPVARHIPGEIDIFLSQVIWKLPRAGGQTWHQDSGIFPFEPARPVIGVWIARTDADPDNSCLHVVPGSHRREVLAHSYQGRHLSLTDQDVAGGVALPARQGDMIIFDSHLMHSTTDNRTSAARMAMTFHYAARGTIDRTAEVFGASPYNDWMPVTPSRQNLVETAAVDGLMR